jgi:CRP-like cAMP-binding protein
MPKLSIVEKVIALEGVEVFANLTPDQMARIAVITKEVQSAPGEWIANGSKRIDFLYVIMDGSVELCHGEEPLSRVGPGHVIGMWTIFEDADLMPVMAKAIEDTRMLRIDREDFYELLADHAEITSAIFSTLVRRLHAGGVR